jgi:hypothetical protein
MESSGSFVSSSETGKGMKGMMGGWFLMGVSGGSSLSESLLFVALRN